MARRSRRVPVRDQHPAGGRVRLHVFGPTPAASVRSAFDACAGATERGDVADLHRHRAKRGARAAAVRRRSISRRTVERRAGPAGYDAMFSLEPDAGDDMPRRIFAKPVEVQISGSILTYDINDPLGGRGEPVKALAAQFPDLRRFIREGYLRYAFTRFGVPYVVSIACLDSVALAQRLACREAYPVAERFLKALHVAGGQPSRPRNDIPAGIAERPAERSPDFTYRPSGDIITRNGSRNPGGHADFTAYAQIRFPLEKAPAFAHSQF